MCQVAGWLVSASGAFATLLGKKCARAAGAAAGSWLLRRPWWVPGCSRDSLCKPVSRTRTKAHFSSAEPRQALLRDCSGLASIVFDRSGEKRRKEK